jgi:hypothetical protein
MTEAGKINNEAPAASAAPQPAQPALPPKLGARRGRPSKLSKKLLDDVCNMIREITPPHVACARAGITTQCLNGWRRRGKLALEQIAAGEPVPDEEMPFADFETALGQALGDATALLIRLNLGHAKKNPITAWRLLESFEPAFRQQLSTTTTLNANVKSESEHKVSGSVGVEVDQKARGALTVQGADAIRREILLGGKTLPQARAEFEAKKKLQGQAPVRALPPSAG